MRSDLLKKIIPLIDLTSLNDSDTTETIDSLCQKAMTPLGPVAAVCVFSKFIPEVKEKLTNKSIHIASVANFPDGDDSAQSVVTAIKHMKKMGANEIDVVFPYKKYLSGEKHQACDLIKKCKDACGKKIILKVILETGAFPDDEKLELASRDVLLSGADFLKTSTGRFQHGPTLNAAKILLIAIKNAVDCAHRPFGFKISGGISTIDQAMQYIDLAERILGPQWITPQTFRIGSSRLLDAITYPS